MMITSLHTTTATAASQVCQVLLLLVTAWIQ
jgi:hypothetical protein